MSPSVTACVCVRERHLLTQWVCKQVKTTFSIHVAPMSSQHTSSVLSFLASHWAFSPFHKAAILHLSQLNRSYQEPTDLWPFSTSVLPLCLTSFLHIFCPHLVKTFPRSSCKSSSYSASPVYPPFPKTPTPSHPPTLTPLSLFPPAVMWL